MFNGQSKADALQALERAQKRYQERADSVNELSQDLFEVRRRSALVVIDETERYLKNTVNTPVSFARTLSEFKAERQLFDEPIRKLELEAFQVGDKAGTAATAGTIAGAGVVTLAPTAAMAVATTFGTASTGAAISSLSGAAATNAALAWLGGGTLAAGGGGMAGGSAFLALAGPVGWAIGGVACVGSAVWFSAKNASIAKQARLGRTAVAEMTQQLERAGEEVASITKQTKRHSEQAQTLLTRLAHEAPHDYRQFKDVHKAMIQDLQGHIATLSELLGRKVEL